MVEFFKGIICGWRIYLLTEKKKNYNLDKLHKDRELVLNSITDPLRFLGLLALIAETIFIVLANTVTDNAVILWAPIVIIALVILVLLILVLFRPDALLGIRKRAEEAKFWLILQDLMAVFIDSISYYLEENTKKINGHFFTIEIGDITEKKNGEEVKTRKELLIKKVRCINEKNLSFETQLDKVSADDPTLIITRAYNEGTIIAEKDLTKKHADIVELDRKKIDRIINWVIAKPIKNKMDKTIGIIDFFGTGEYPFEEKHIKQVMKLIGDFGNIIEDLFSNMFGDNIDFRKNNEKTNKKK